MIIKRLALYAAVVWAWWMPCGNATAQETGSIQTEKRLSDTPIEALRLVDEALDRRDSASFRRTDTAYIRRAGERLRLKMSLNVSGSLIEVKGENATWGKFSSSLEARNKYTVSVSASYRGLSLGVAINPAHLAGKNKDLEFNLNAYANRVGADVIYQSASTFGGSFSSDEGVVDINPGHVSQRMLRLNTYYAFGARRFSFPAAFSMSWIQKRSHGSLMAGLSLHASDSKIEDSPIGLLSGDGQSGESYSSRLRMVQVGIGMGYGYNWVVARKWLIHASTIPQLVVFSRSDFTIGEQREASPYRFPSFTTVGRLAVVRHFERYFAGMTAVVNTSFVGRSRQLLVSQVKWRGRVFVGIKLWRGKREETGGVPY